MAEVKGSRGQVVGTLELPRGRYGARISDKAFGVGLGNTGLHETAKADALFKKQEQQESVDLAVDMYTKASEKLGELESDTRNREGRSALTVKKDTIEGLSKIQDEAIANLKNNASKRAFARMWRARRETALNAAVRHEDQQRSVFHQQSTLGAMVNMRDEAGRNWTDDVALEVNAGLYRILSETRHQDAPESAREGLVRQDLSAYHLAALNPMYINGPSVGKRHFEKYKDDIDSSLHPEIQEKLETGSLSVETQGLADGLMREFDDPRERHRVARERTEGPKEDQLINRLVTLEAEKAKFDAADQVAEYEAVLEQIEEGFDSGASIHELYAVAEQLEKKKDVKGAKEYVRVRVSGRYVTDDPAVVEELKLMAADPDRVDEYGSLPLRTRYPGKLSEKTLKFHDKQQKHALNRTGEWEAYRRGILTELQQVKASLPSRWSKDDVNAFTLALDERLLQRRTETLMGLRRLLPKTPA